MLLRHGHCIQQLIRFSYKRVCDFLAFPTHEEETWGGTPVAVAPSRNEIESQVQHDLGNAIHTYEIGAIPEVDDSIQSYPQFMGSESCGYPNSQSGIEHSGVEDWTQSFPQVIGGGPFNNVSSAGGSEVDVFNGFHQFSMFRR